MEVAVVEVWFVDLNHVLAVELSKILQVDDLKPPQVANSFALKNSASLRVNSVTLRLECVM